MRRGAPSRLTIMSFAVFVAGCGLWAETVPAEWTLREPPEGRVLELRAGTGVPCNELEAVDVEETPEAVTISARVRLASGGCDDMFDVQDVEVEFDEPLGDRELRGCAPEGEEAIRQGPPNRGCLRVDE